MLTNHYLLAGSANAAYAYYASQMMGGQSAGAPVSSTPRIDRGVQETQRQSTRPQGGTPASFADYLRPKQSFSDLLGPSFSFYSSEFSNVFEQQPQAPEIQIPLATREKFTAQEVLPPLPPSAEPQASLFEAGTNSEDATPYYFADNYPVERGAYDRAMSFRQRAFALPPSLDLIG